MPDPRGHHAPVPLLESLADPAVTADEAGRVVAWNAAAAERLSLDPRWVGRGVDELAAVAGLGAAVRLPLRDGGAHQIVAWPAEALPTGSSPVPPAHAEATLTQRARVVERLAGSAWHELAQPLGGLRGFVSMLQLEGWTQEQLGVDPGLVEDAAAAAERLTRALTELARGSTRPVSVHALVTDLLALAGHLLVDVAVDVAIPADAPETEVDPSLLRLVVASLLVDRIDALGGPREARGRMRWEARHVAAGGEDALTIVVEDDGAAPEPHQLAVLESLLADAGGTLRSERGLGAGSRLVAELPVRGAATPPEPGPAPDAAPPATTVLVCDDDVVVRSLLTRVLDRDGLRVVGAETGEEALTLLDHEPVDVVLADHHMAGMTGLELHARASERHPRLRRRFVLMSGDAGDAELVAFAQAEGLRVLAKPFELATLPATLREVGEG